LKSELQTKLNFGTGFVELYAHMMFDEIIVNMRLII